MRTKLTTAKVLAENLRWLQSVSKIRQKDLAEQSALGTTTITRVLKGEDPVKSDTIDALAAIFHLDTWLLICEKWEIINVHGENFLFLPQTLLPLAKTLDGEEPARESTHQTPKKRPLAFIGLQEEQFVPLKPSGAAHLIAPDEGAPTRLEASKHEITRNSTPRKKQRKVRKRVRRG